MYNISYCIRLWINIAMEGLARVLLVGWWTIRKHHCLNYGKVGMDFVDDGGQGGVFMDPWKMEEIDLIR